MRKEDAISIISKGLNKTKKVAEESMADIDESIELLVGELEVGDKVKLGNYITFKRVTVPERTYRNPRTNENVLVSEHEEVKVSVTQAFKDLVNK